MILCKSQLDELAMLQSIQISAQLTRVINFETFKNKLLDKELWDSICSDLEALLMTQKWIQAISISDEDEVEAIGVISEALENLQNEKFFNYQMKGAVSWVYQFSESTVPMSLEEHLDTILDLEVNEVCSFHDIRLTRFR